MLTRMGGRRKKRRERISGWIKFSRCDVIAIYLFKSLIIISVNVGETYVRLLFPYIPDNSPLRRIFQFRHNNSRDKRLTGSKILATVQLNMDCRVESVIGELPNGFINTAIGVRREIKSLSCLIWLKPINIYKQMA